MQQKFFLIGFVLALLFCSALRVYGQDTMFQQILTGNIFEQQMLRGIDNETIKNDNWINKKNGIFQRKLYEFKTKDNVYGVVDSLHRVLCSKKQDSLFYSFGSCHYKTDDGFHTYLIYSDDNRHERAIDLDNNYSVSAPYSSISMKDAGDDGWTYNVDYFIKTYHDSAFQVYNYRFDKPLSSHYYTNEIKRCSYWIVEKDKKYGLLHFEKGEILPPIYDEIEDKYGMFTFKKNGKWGYFQHPISKETAYAIVTPQYDSIYSCNYLLLKKKEKWGVVSRQRKQILPFQYENFSLSGPYWGCGQGAMVCAEMYTYNIKFPCIARKKNKMGLINFKNQAILPFVYDSLLHRYHEKNREITYWYIAKKQGKWGMFSETGKVMIPLQYDAVFKQRNILWFAKGKKWGLLDSTGTTLLPFVYDSLTTHHHDCVLVWMNGLCGLYQSGRSSLSIPVLYDSLNFEEYKDDNAIYTAKKGNETIEIAVKQTY